MCFLLNFPVEGTQKTHTSHGNIGHLEGEQPSLGNVFMVINHLQVLGAHPPSKGPNSTYFGVSYNSSGTHVFSAIYRDNKFTNQSGGTEIMKLNPWVPSKIVLKTIPRREPTR